MINIYDINKMLFIADSFKKIIEKWDKQLDVFSATYTDSPWAGMVIFLVLLVIGVIAVKNHVGR